MSFLPLNRIAAHRIVRLSAAQLLTANTATLVGVQPALIHVLARSFSLGAKRTLSKSWQISSFPATTNHAKYMSSSTTTIINTPNAPAAIGPYSQAVVANGFIFTAGQIPLITETMTILDGDVQAQTRLVLTNLKNVLEAAGSSFDKIVKTTVFLKDMNDFAKMNQVYEEMMGSARPARSAVEVARLPRDVKVEIECVAVVPN
ncbi:hypothetical protein BSLG_007800 [Batrachochytrium salamandrivorans]|nr:hypothetical protein BSLG_007800 [Batrachochytrium salamandrivorans]